MALGEISQYVLRYTVVAAGAAVAVLFGVAFWTEFPLQLLTMVLLGLTMVGALFLTGGTDMQTETAAAGAEAGFVPDDYNDLRARMGALPGRYEVGFFLVGLGIDAAVVMGVLAVLS